MAASIVRTVKLQAITETDDTTCEPIPCDNRRDYEDKADLSAYRCYGGTSNLVDVSNVVSPHSLLRRVRETRYHLFLLIRSSIRVEAYLVLLAVSIPTLRPILRSKTTFTPYELRSYRNGARAGDPRAIGVSAGNSMLTESHNMAPFERLWEPDTPMNNISGGEGGDGYNMGTHKGVV